MLSIQNKTSEKLNYNIIEKIAKSLTSKEIELIFLNNEEIRKINKEFRGKDSPTDVISFPFEDVPNAPLGTILISIDKAKAAASEYGHTLEDEIALLFIHGLLHLLGYDHEVDNGEMREMEKKLIQKFNLPKSLIVRTEDGC